MAARSVSIDIYIKTIDARTATMTARSVSIDIYIETIDARNVSIDAASKQSMLTVKQSMLTVKQSILTVYQRHFDMQNKKVTSLQIRDL